MTMKRRIFNSVIAIVFLSGFLISQSIIFGHNYYGSSQKYSQKHTKSSSITEKCRVCELQMHNNLLFESHDVLNPIFVAFDTPCTYMQSYSGVKLVISSSRAPPVV